MASFAQTLCGRKQDDEPPEQPVRPVVPVSVKSADHQKKLFNAIESCDLLQIMKLKEEFSFKDIKDNHQRTPLHVLAEIKPTPDNDVKDDVLKKLFTVLKDAGCDVDGCDKFGNTPVKLAAEKGCLQVLRCLIEAKASVNLADKYKEDTPLHWAAKNDMVDAVQLLIQNGAHLNPQNKDKKTPLHLAVQNKCKNIVQLLLYNGADKTLKDNNGFTPLCIAERDNCKKISKILKKSSQELSKMYNENGKGEFVQADSGSSGNILPMIRLLPGKPIPTVQVNIYNDPIYNVKVKDGGIAAIGTNPKVMNCSSEAPAVPQPNSIAHSSLMTGQGGEVQSREVTSLPSSGNIPTATISRPATDNTTIRPATDNTTIRPTAPLSPMDTSTPLSPTAVTPTAPPLEEDEDNPLGERT